MRCDNKITRKYKIRVGIACLQYLHTMYIRLRCRMSDLKSISRWRNEEGRLGPLTWFERDDSKSSQVYRDTILMRKK